MKKIDSQALGVMQKALGLTGAGSQETELLDSSVDQVVDVVPVARRSQTIAGSEGLFRLVLRNIHAGAGALSAAIEPYNTGAAAIAPFPGVIPTQFDLWALGASVTRLSGAGDLNRASLLIANVAQGAGIDDSGVAVESNTPFICAYWSELITTLSNVIALEGPAEGVHPWNRLGIRIPRLGLAAGSPVRLAFESNAGGVATFDCSVLIGMFPISLGQDAI